MALVKSYISERGNTINIYDDYCVKTQKEIDEILDRVGRIAGEAQIAKEKRRRLVVEAEEKRA